MGPRLVSRGNTSRIRSIRGTHLRLQWGHGLLAVEIATAGQFRVLFSKLQWGHGLLAVEMSRLVRWPSRSLRPASMGPRLVSRGNPRILPIRKQLSRWLQWGHGLLAVEIPLP